MLSPTVVGTTNTVEESMYSSSGAPQLVRGFPGAACQCLIQSVTSLAADKVQHPSITLLCKTQLVAVNQFLLRDL